MATAPRRPGWKRWWHGREVAGLCQLVKREEFYDEHPSERCGSWPIFRAESCCRKGNRVYLLLLLISVVLGFYPSHNCPSLPAPTDVALRNISYVIMAAAHLLIWRRDTRGPLILVDVRGSSLTENDVMKSHVSPRSSFCAHRVDL